MDSEDSCRREMLPSQSAEGPLGCHRDSWSATLLALAWLGLYEGGYNDLLRNNFFAACVSEEVFLSALPGSDLRAAGRFDLRTIRHSAAAARIVCRLGARWLWRTAGPTRRYSIEPITLVSAGPIIERLPNASRAPRGSESHGPAILDSPV